MSVASVAQLLQEQGGGGGGSVNDVIGGTGISVTADSFGDYTVNNDGVLDLTAGSGIEITETAGNYTITNIGGGGGGVSSIIAGSGIAIAPDPGVGDVTITNQAVLALQSGSGITITGTNAQLTITSDVNPADYYTSVQSDGLFQTLADMANYYTSIQINNTFQTLADMANYSTTAVANGLYQPILTYTPYIYQRVFNGNLAISAGQTQDFSAVGEEIITNIPYNVNTIYQFTFTSGQNSPPITLVSYTAALNAPGTDTIFTSTVCYNSSSTVTAYIHTITVLGMVPNV